MSIHKSRQQEFPVFQVPEVKFIFTAVPWGFGHGDLNHRPLNVAPDAYDHAFLRDDDDSPADILDLRQRDRMYYVPVNDTDLTLYTQ